jgi:hypothetical protein
MKGVQNRGWNVIDKWKLEGNSKSKGMKGVQNRGWNVPRLKDRELPDYGQAIFMFISVGMAHRQKTC